MKQTTKEEREKHVAQMRANHRIEGFKPDTEDFIHAAEIHRRGSIVGRHAKAGPEIRRIHARQVLITLPLLVLAAQLEGAAGASPLQTDA